METLARLAKRRAALVAAVGLGILMLSGCGSAVDRLLANEELRTQLWERVAASPELSGQVVDRLLGADSTRAALLDRVMASGGARQRLLTMIGKDRTLMDGALNFAVQDTAMREHLTTLFRGIEMGGARRSLPATQP